MIRSVKIGKPASTVSVTAEVDTYEEAVALERLLAGLKSFVEASGAEGVDRFFGGNG